MVNNDDDESHGIESVKNHHPPKQKIQAYPLGSMLRLYIYLHEDTIKKYQTNSYIGKYTFHIYIYTFPNLDQTQPHGRYSRYLPTYLP